MKIISDLIGTKLSEFRIKLASISSASLTAIRTYTLPDKNITIAGLDDILPTTLSGLSASVGTLSNTDTILQAFNKIAGLIDNESWVSYTPSTTGSGLTLGNGTITGRYKKIGKTVHNTISITLGSTSAISGSGVNWSYFLPSGIAPLNPRSVICSGVYGDASTGLGYPLYIWFYVLGYNSGSFISQISNTLPFTWAINDTIFLNMTYETA